MMNEEKQNRLAKLIQTAFPVETYPFQTLAKQIASSEDEVIAQVEAWKEKRLLREISAIMEGGLLHHDSALVCAKVPKNRLKEVADIISEHPMVTHNYEREYDLNLWFTIATPPGMSLDKTLDIFQVLTGIEKFYPLRKTHTFKIGVTIDFLSKSNATNAPNQKVSQTQSTSLFEITTEAKKNIRALQKNLPICSRPFKVLAEQNDLAEEQIIEFVQKNIGQAVRKYIGTFRHRKLGVSANGMVIWNIAGDGKLVEAGERLAGFPDVSHCFARTPASAFPYSLYTMLHGPNIEYIKEVVSRMATELNCDDYLILNSTTQFKKCRLRYFLPELDNWWEQNEKHLS